MYLGCDEYMDINSCIDNSFCQWCNVNTTIYNIKTSNFNTPGVCKPNTECLYNSTECISNNHIVKGIISFSENIFTVITQVFEMYCFPNKLLFRMCDARALRWHMNLDELPSNCVNPQAPFGVHQAAKDSFASTLNAILVDL